ncbi:MAG: hypothetical protein AB1735_09085, partial [Pseudomonadota bacterium]
SLANPNSFRLNLATISEASHYDTVSCTLSKHSKKFFRGLGEGCAAQLQDQEPGFRHKGSCWTA